MEGVLRLADGKALDYINQKSKSLPTNKWNDIKYTAHAKAFVISTFTETAFLDDVLKDIKKSVENGTGLGEFRKKFRENIAKRGWIKGKFADKDYFAWRSRLIFETNTKNAYNAARWERFMEDTEDFPYLEYRHGYYGEPGNPRDEHKSWNGKVLPKNDIWWNTHGEQCGWNCHCGIVELTRRQAARKLGVSAKSLGKFGNDSWQNERKKGYPEGVSPRSNWGIQDGWDYNPGINDSRGEISHFEHLKKVEPELRGMTIEKLHNESGKLYEHSLDLWVDDIWKGKNSSVQSERVIGWANEKLDGKPITANFNNVKHSVGERKDRTASGGTNQRITKEQAKKIPDILANPDSIYYDTENDNYLFYREIDTENEIKIAVKNSENKLQLNTIVKQNPKFAQDKIEWVSGKIR